MGFFIQKIGFRKGRHTFFGAKGTKDRRIVKRKFRKIYPAECRLRNLTYHGTVSVNIYTELYYENIQTLEKKLFYWI